MPAFKPAEIISFTYKSPVPSPPDHSGPNKRVFVLNPNWLGLLHGIDLGMLTFAEIEVLDTIFDPLIWQEVQKGFKHKLPLVNDILKRMNPVKDIKNPVSFYAKFVRPFLHGKDAYRTYYPRGMINPVVNKTNIKGKVINPKPLFDRLSNKQSGLSNKVEGSPLSNKDENSALSNKKGTPDRLELIKQRASKLSNNKASKNTFSKTIKPKKNK